MGKGGDAIKGEILSANNKNDNKENDPATETTEAVHKHRPWYIRGGMHVNEVGMGLNVVVPPVFLAMTAAASSLHPSFTPVQIFATLWILQAIVAVSQGMITVFCVAAVPCYFTSLLVLPATLSTSILPTIALGIFISIWRTGICMSVCLHRYAAHAAFKCGPGMQLFLNVLGCASHQGGPIWWASQHRCHHKHCDMPRDPHSAIQDGVEKAFAFFSTGHAAMEEEFAPKHNDTWYLRLLDTWSFVVCTAEMYLAHRYFGREGLFVSYTSIWICQTITLWFNIVNHPPDVHPEKVCQATNFKGGSMAGLYPTFRLLDALYSTFGLIVSEAAHEVHHVHFMLAKREKYDVMYHSFVLPLEKMGLVWDVKIAPPE
mmetsp:Transcript_19190/g.40199  ORF Transcript_19190/g.40199 Transcript_19190/m.40199 type:complete len:373 (-) Transcript_19190:99-1217(-)